MENIFKKFICIIFSVFSAITFLLFVFRDNMSIRSIVFSVLIVLVAYVFARFPFIYKIEIKRPRLVLLLITVLAVIPRVIWVNLVHVTPYSDFYTYHTLAGAMAKGELLYPVYISLFPHVYGYSKVLSILYAIFGDSPFTAVYFNIAVNIGILLLLYYLGRRFYDAKTGLTAALVYAFWPSQIFYNTLVLTEPFYTFGILLVICLYVIVIDKGHNMAFQILSFFGLGLAIGLLKYIRPASLILLIAIVIHYIFAEILRFRVGFLKKATARNMVWYKIMLPIILIIAYTAASFIVRNGIERDIGVEIARQSNGFNIFVGMNKQSEGKWTAEDSSLLQPMIDKGMSSTEIMDTFSAMGMERLKNMDLLTHIKHQLNKNRNMWGSDSESLGYTQLAISATSHINISKHINWLSYIANGYYFVFFILASAAFIVLKEKTSDQSILLYLYILGTVAVHMLVEVHCRYHYTAVPLLCVLASAALARSQPLTVADKNAQ
jgi:4-amino-4-deoxy-L-arabinose transferase-like glycosyltransferase